MKDHIKHIQLMRAITKLTKAVEHNTAINLARYQLELNKQMDTHAKAVQSKRPMTQLEKHLEEQKRKVGLGG